PHLAIEKLRNMLQQKMRTATRHHVVRQQSFADRLMELMRQYTNQNLSAAEVTAEIVNMSREIAADANRGEQFDPPLTEAELAFYDAVAQNESAVREVSTGKLADIARDLVSSLRKDVTTDWVSRDDVRAKLRSTIKRLLAKHDYPPDAEPAASGSCSPRWKPSPKTGHPRCRGDEPQVTNTGAWEAKTMAGVANTAAWLAM